MISALNNFIEYSNAIYVYSVIQFVYGLLYQSYSLVGY